MKTLENSNKNDQNKIFLITVGKISPLYVNEVFLVP